LSSPVLYDIKSVLELEMGISRDSGSCEIDIIKEMAEGLGSSGLKLEDLLEKAEAARQEALEVVARFHDGRLQKDRLDISLVNDFIGRYNELVEKAEDALRWLLIQREACGFRTHRNVDRHYPIPQRMRPLKK
jgi:hypothetical protein